MAHIRIDFSDLRSAAKASGDTAQEMDDYATRITNRLSNRLGSLGDSGTGHVSSAADLAAKKASSMRQKAERYRRVKSGLETFAGHAEQQDKAAGTRIKAIKTRDMEGLSKMQQVGATVYEWFHTTFGLSTTEFGRSLNNIARIKERQVEYVTTAVQKVRDYFQYGKGRYILKGALAVGAAIGAFVALFNPIVGPAAALFFAAGVIAAVYKAGTAYRTVQDTIEALKLEDEDPGRARYYGKTSSLKDYAKKHSTSREAQNRAGRLDVIGNVADIVSSVGRTFTKTGTMTFDNGDGTTTTKKINQLSWSKQTAKENIGKKFGFSWDVQKDGAGRIIHNVDQSEAMARHWSAGNLIKNVAGFKSAEEGTNTFTNIWNKVEAAGKNVKAADKLVSDYESQRRSLTFTGSFSSSDYEHLVKRIPWFGSFYGSGLNTTEALG